MDASWTEENEPNLALDERVLRKERGHLDAVAVARGFRAPEFILKRPGSWKPALPQRGRKTLLMSISRARRCNSRNKCVNSMSTLAGKNIPAKRMATTLADGSTDCAQSALLWQPTPADWKKKDHVVRISEVMISFQLRERSSEIQVTQQEKKVRIQSTVRVSVR